MKNPIIDNSQKNSDSISDKVNISSKRSQDALKILENIEDDFMRIANANPTVSKGKIKKQDFFKKIKANSLNDSIEKYGIEYHKNLIFTKLLKYNKLNKKNEVIESLNKKYASSEELLNCIKIYSEEIFI